jgi:hypothetical protein
MNEEYSETDRISYETFRDFLIELDPSSANRVPESGEEEVNISERVLFETELANLQRSENNDRLIAALQDM